MNYLAAAIFVSSNIFAGAFAAPPSSEIPARREFPLSTTIKPCDDFHGYVCSNVEASFKLRDDRSYHTFSFSDSNERILEYKKKFLQSIHTDTGLSSRSKQVRDFYLACMNEKAGVTSEKKEVAKRVNELKNIKTSAQL
ncbi:MAG: M13 family peptidase, partial [Proteobacteria bacterium]